MCGVAGYVSRDPDCVERLRQQIPAAIKALHHRGPDDQGSWFSPDSRTGLGHARLSILDLSTHGHQPMVSANGRLVMVFNGEVYNFAANRSELMSVRHQFAGAGNTGVAFAGSPDVA